MKNKKIICDNCNHKFEIKKMKSEKMGEYRGNIVEFNFFNCRKCSLKYFVSADYKEINDLITKYRHNQMTMHMLDTVRNREEKKVLSDENKRLQDEARALTEMLKGMFSWS
ncbi:hypothetical protein ACM26V_16895 [Salipaludibacillus sp. HK11]|uniref:hypothetical protein n=1 Tax=Salipaludibacillus sp. HK11 TaxID=3394320 RepID=UPI0039FC2B5E